MLAAAPLAASLYGAPALVGVLSLMALAMPVTAAASVPMAVLRAELRFGLLAGYATAELAGMQLLTVLLAWRGFGPLSFAVPTLVAAVVRAATFWAIAAPRLHWAHLRRRQVAYLAGSGFAVFGVITAAVGQFGAVAGPRRFARRGRDLLLRVAARRAAGEHDGGQLQRGPLPRAVEARRRP